MEFTAGSTTGSQRNGKDSDTIFLSPFLPHALPFLPFLCMSAPFWFPLQTSVSEDTLACLEKISGLIIIGPEWVM